MRATYLGCCAMVTAFGAAFLIMGLIPMHVFWYHPLEHRWLFEIRPEGLAMDFYGRTLYAALASGLAYAGGHWLGGKSDRTIAPQQASLWLGYALAFIVLAMCLIGYQLWPRVPTPLPVPVWYVPQ